MSFEVQDLVHRMESGGGARFFRVLFVLIVVITIAALYDSFAFKNLANREAMDAAQLAKNLADGKGYTTLFVRPFSVFLLQNHRADRSPLLKTPHPDLANPPVYPCLLAGVFKLLPRGVFTMPGKGFSIYMPDLAVALLNQTLLLIAGLLLFFLAARLFDSTMAWVTSVVFVGSESFWRFSLSGLNTMLLVVLLLVVVWCLVVLERWARFGRPDWRLLLLAGLTGLLVGVGGLTRYAFGWLILPILVFLIAFFDQKRAVLCLALLSGFLAVMSPWVVRNYSLCGMPFGTATFTVCETTVSFPEDRLQRSLHPNLRSLTATDFSRKFLLNSRELVQNDLPKLGGNWVAAFFVVGLLVPFRNQALSRLRWLLLFSLLVFGPVQVMSRTSLSNESMDTSPENMLVLLAPLIFMYGVALFFLLMDSIALPFQAARVALIVAFCVVASLPLIQTLLPPHGSPIAYPPYFPPLIQRVGGWFSEKELLMSDMPAAVAWYGRRQCLWATLNWKKDFVEVTDLLKPIKGIYLTPLTTDSPFLSNWVRGENRSWASFLLDSVVQREVPPGFPLRRAPEGFFPEQLLLTDYDRWKLKKE
jgi:hypothetical protein